MADQNGPRSRKPREPSGPQVLINQLEYQISFDPRAFDLFIKSHGIWVTHYMAIPDPRGMASRGDNRDVLSARPKDSDGFIYKKVADMQVLFTANTKYIDNKDLGEVAFSAAYMTMPRYYNGTTKEVILSSWDRFFLKDIEIKVAEKQFIEATRDGIDRLHYPAVEVDAVVDSNGVFYDLGKDFSITSGGDIQWISQKRPGWNATTGKGTVYTVCYKYTPYFVVNRMMHEIRVAQITNPATMKRNLERMPYQVQVFRENVYRDNKTENERLEVNPRVENSPEVGGALGTKINVGGALGPKT